MIIGVNNVPANAVVDVASCRSQISNRFLFSSLSTVTTSDSTVLCRVFVVVDNKPIYVDVVFDVKDALAYDVILGADWRQAIGREQVIAPACSLSESSPSSMDCEVDRQDVDPGRVADYSSMPRYSTPADNEVQCGYNILFENLFGHSTRGVQASVFKISAVQIYELMALHGLAEVEGEVGMCRRELVRHIICGSCVSEDGTGDACKKIRRGFSSAVDLSVRILRDVVETRLASVWPTDNLRIIASSLDISYSSVGHNVRRDIQTLLRARLDMLQSASSRDVLTLSDMFRTFERHSRSTLAQLCSQHFISVASGDSSEELRCLLCEHLISGGCMVADGRQCQYLRDQWLANADGQEWTLFFLSNIVDSRIALKPLQRLLRAVNIPFRSEDSLSRLRSTLRTYIRTLTKGKHRLRDAESASFTAKSDSLRKEKAMRPRQGVRYQVAADPIHVDDANTEVPLSREWPSILSSTSKDNLIRMFQDETSSAALSSATCAACAESVLKIELTELTTDDFDCDLLKRPDLCDDESDESVGCNWLDSDESYHPPMPLQKDTAMEHFWDIMLDPSGVIKVETKDRLRLRICKKCNKSLKAGRVPPLALANRTYLGDVPDELKNLTVVEEAMIARCRAKCWIVQLKEEFSNIELPNNQRGVKGHIIIYPQNTSSIARLLPPPIHEVTSPICVLFVGSQPPTAEWLREKAKPLAVRPAVVRKALLWLKQHNPLYRDIIINDPVLNSMSDTEILPFTIQHVTSSVATETQTSRYDSSIQEQQDAVGGVSWQNVVITNVDSEASANTLRAAAFRHVNDKKGGYIQIPHDPTPVNEFIDPKLFPMIYPTLFPYGIGGFRDQDRESALSMQQHVKHLFNLNDRRFQEHYSFLFTAFNMLQRHSILLYTKLKTQRSNFDKLAVALSNIDMRVVHSVIERMGRGESVTEKWTAEEAKLFTLMREVSAISSNIPGSVSARTTMRNEIQALMVDKGLPNFYVTINPADVYNPIVNVLAGSEIDVDNIGENEASDYWTQSTLVAKNPAVAAKFFNVYMKAFITCLLRYDSNCSKRQPGALGIVKAYYGCVEAQGRGTLHCHMLIWIEGGLNPNDLKRQVLEDESFRRRLLAYLDDTISNRIPNPPENDIAVPSDKQHPCSVRGVKIQDKGLENCQMRQKDMSNLVRQCQKHTHTRTCYKYFKGSPGERKECRFNLDEKNIRNESRVDPDTGELSLRKLDGMVNNFNATILEAVRCNMDVQFVGSGVSAKAMVYYMTDYITKTTLKTHVALAALELAVTQTEKYVPNEAEPSIRAKALLRKCAYVLLSHQELSAPQVASYLMGYEDHFKSHRFVNLYWPSCERFIDSQSPSPECGGRRAQEGEACPPIEGAAESEPEPSCEDEDNGAEWDDVHESRSDVEFENQADAETEEVLVTVDSEGQLVASTDLSEDYRFRGDALKDFNLWEFRARVQKMKKAKTLREGMDVDEDRPALHYLLRKDLYVPFKNGHSQSDTHILQYSPKRERMVPVPIGPKIPRRDTSETLPRFCRLMLILFKPWTAVSDLRRDGESWEDAYQHFLSSASQNVRHIIENTQILHECRDSRDTHFAERRRQQRQFVTEPHGFSHDDGGADGVLAEEVSHEDILRHLQQVQSCYDNKIDVNQKKMTECLRYAETYGLYDVGVVGSTASLDDSVDTKIQMSDGCLEDAWEAEYEKRRNQWKKKVSMPMSNAESVREGTTSAHINVAVAEVEAGPSRPADVENSLVARIEANSDTVKDVGLSILDRTAQKWNLTREQTRAFRIIAEHSIRENEPQLRMFVGGAGGAGKSRVINSLREFFELNGQSRRLRLASFTGIASRNINGVTLHASLFLNQRSSQKVRAKTLRDLVTVWDGVDYLVVDEVSMVGCNLLYDVSKSLSEARSNPHPFGGINIIFVGDFAQLPPVCETRLFARLNPHSKGGAMDQKKIFGKLLWLSVDTVVILTQIMRQCESKDRDFVELLGRLRTGRCNAQDFALLNTRLLSKTNAAINNPLIWNTPMLVTQNAIKDFMNEKGVESFSRRSGRTLYWYYALDKVNGDEITDTDLKRHLRALSTSQTNQRLGRLPLVIGMPVMITQNFDVEHGIVNGSIGTLKSVRYVVNGSGERHATSCVVEIPNLSGPTLANLEAGEAAVIRDTVSMTFRHPYTGKNCTIRRTQLPLVPAFCLTVHKAQGQTMERVIVDLEDCRGTEAPYVMLSRVKSLEGLHILRPFQYRKITVHPSQESRIEFQRLEILRLQTLMKYGTDTEREDAKMALKGAQISFEELGNIDINLPASPQLLRNAQQTVIEQTALLDNDAESSVMQTRKRARQPSSHPQRRVRRRIDEVAWL